MLFYIANNAILKEILFIPERRIKTVVFPSEPSPETSRPQGYLKEPFRFFHLKDLEKGPYEYHHHDFLKILILISGRVSYSIEGRSYDLAPWDMVLVDRGQIHRPEPDPTFPYERLILYLSPAFLKAHKYADSDLTLCFSTASYRHSQVLRFTDEERRPMASLLKQLENETDGKNKDFAASLLSRLLCLEFLILLNRACLSSSGPYVTTGSLDYRISGLMAHINSHLSEDLSIPALSSVCSLSPYHMMRVFKEETGFTIGNYITEKRLARARELLALGENATTSCYQCGFQNYSTFLRAYKRRYGQLPKEFQKGLI